jgi:hypothetical protein
MFKLSKKPKCGKCGRGHEIENCGFKCSYCFGSSHIEEHCWKKNGKGPIAITNYLEVLVNDEEATLTELNQLCGVKKHIFKNKSSKVQKSNYWC